MGYVYNEILNSSKKWVNWSNADQCDWFPGA